MSPLRETSAISRRSLTLLPNCCKASSEKTRTLAVWFMALPVSRWEHRLNWKSFLKSLTKTGPMMRRTRAAQILIVALSLALLALGQSNGKQPTMAHPIFYRTIKIDEVSIFYRETGPKDAPTILLLHGLPTSSRQFEPLFARLSDRFHLVAPDYPGFGHSDWPDPKKFSYTFDHIAEVMTHFTEAI